MKDIPIIFSAPMVNALLAGRKTMTRRLLYRKASKGKMFSHWPKAKIGDRLWVREALNDEDGLRYAADSTKVDCKHAPENFVTTRTTTMPGMFMPRWASRLTLTITATKIEPVQSITTADAIKEGVCEDDGSEPDIWFIPGTGGTEVGRKMNPLTANKPPKVFKSLWEALHGVESWQQNPEVVALTFTVQKCNIDQNAVAA